MTEEITKWFNETFWPLYPSDLSHGKKGPKSVALKSMLKLNPDDNMRQDIINKLRVLIRFAKTEKRCGKEPDRWPFASTFINQTRWNDVLDMQMPSTVIDKRVCCVDGCKRPVAVVDKCGRHWDEANQNNATFSMKFLYENLKKEGLAIENFESRAEWIQACKARAIPRLARLNKGGNMGRVQGRQ